MHISTMNISKMVTDRANVNIVNKQEVAYGFSIVIFALTLDLKVKVMHILTVNISEMVTNWAKITINNKQKVAYMAFQFAYLHLTLAHSKGQGLGHAHFNSKYL